MKNACIHGIKLRKRCRECEKEMEGRCAHETEYTGELDKGRRVSKCILCEKEFVEMKF